MTDNTKLFGTGICTGDLGLLIAKLRELRVSHAKVGPVEVWLEREYAPAPAGLLSGAALAGDDGANLAAPVDPSEWTEEEAAYLP